MPDPPTIKFLLVDDLEANLAALEALLKRDRLELMRARSGPEALELLLVHEFALALIDVQMPGMNGFELAELMRGTERTKSVPIIFLTAGVVDHQRRIRGYETGAIDFLPKPVDAGMLLNKAAVFYELALQRQELQESQERLRKINGDLAEAVLSRDKFLAMLGHELRNPLAPVLTGVEVLLRSSQDAALVDRIATMMKRQIGQMVHLIDDLLDISRITTGKIELQKSPVALAGIIDQAVESVQPMLAEFRHQLEVENAPPELVIHADPHRLAQVVSNLLSNACKYTPPGGRVVAKVRAVTGAKIQISVQDNGRGIKPEHQARIFEIFEQGESGPREGLGIGLTLVKSLVEMHGGSVTVISEGEGKGSEFTVILPGLREGAALESTSEPPSPSAKLRVLIADDGKTAADMLQVFFQMEGMETAVAYDGEEAVQVAERFKPDLACLDLGMPKIDGYEAARRLRKLCPDAYIVALSGWGSEEDRRKSAEAGFDLHLVKPVSSEDLREVLAKIAAPTGS